MGSKGTRQERNGHGTGKGVCVRICSHVCMWKGGRSLVQRIAGVSSHTNTLSLNHADKTPTLLFLELCECPVEGCVEQILATPYSAGINSERTNTQTHTTGTGPGMQGHARMGDEWERHERRMWSGRQSWEKAIASALISLRNVR